MLAEQFDDYFAARVQPMRRVAFLIVRDWHAADDVVQAAFIKVYRRWRRIQLEGVEAYVRRAVVNESISMLRRRKGEVLGEIPDTARPLTEVNCPDSLTDALEELAPMQRAVVALRFLEDLSVEQVSTLLSISEGTVKSHTSRAVKRLRVLLAEQEER